MTRILALDPASNTGWAHTNGLFGVWRLRERNIASLDREHIYLERFLERAIASMGVDMIATENAGYGSHNPEVQARHNERLGVIRLVAARHQIELQTFNPMTIKMFATGDGHADKHEMVAACNRLLNVQVTTNDEADAVWILHLAMRPDCWKPTNATKKKPKRKFKSKQKGLF